MNFYKIKNTVSVILIVLLSFTSPAAVFCAYNDLEVSAKVLETGDPSPDIAMNKEVLTPAQDKALEKRIEKKDKSLLADGVRQQAKLYRRAVGSARYSSDSDIYSNYYVYNQLDDTSKQYFDQMEVICRRFYDGTENAESDGTLGQIEIKNTTQSKVDSLFWMFRYSHPQYFFLENSYMISRVSGSSDYNLYLTAYSAFINGTKREKARDDMETVVSSWESTASSKSTAEEKIRYIHDTICNNVIYNDTLDHSGNDPNFTQSAYSVFIKKETVCAGYSMAFELLCNGLGIPAFTVTSDQHGWNLVYLEGRWYQMDCTWDDTDLASNPIKYKYYLRSDAKMKELDKNSYHTYSGMWKPYMPNCSADTGSTDSASGWTTDLAAAGSEKPVISETASGSAYDVQISAENYYNGTTPYIFYTTDGVDPSSSLSKSLKNSSTSFTLEDVAKGTTVKAVLEQEERQPSEVTTFIVGSSDSPSSGTEDSSSSGNNGGSADSSGSTDGNSGGSTDGSSSGGNSGGTDGSSSGGNSGSTDNSSSGGNSGGANNSSSGSSAEPEVSNISLNHTYTTLPTGAVCRLSASVYPASSGVKISWYRPMYDSSLRFVQSSDGKAVVLYRTKPGIVPVVVSAGGRTAYCIVEFKNKFVKLTKSSVTVKKGKKAQIKIASRFPSNDKVKKYSTSNGSVVSISSSGVVKGKKKGKAVITVYMKSGTKAKCTVYVR